MPLKNLMSMSSSEVKYFLDSFDDVLCDCDGVIWTSKGPLPGSKEALLKLKKCGKQLYFVTNNCTVGVDGLRKRLNELQLEVQPHCIAYPTMAIIDYLKQIEYRLEIFVVGTSYMKQEFRNAGFIVANEGPDKIDEYFGVLVEHLQDNTNIGAVVFDFDLNLNYIKLLKTLLYLKRPEVIFITGATDKVIPAGLEIPLLGPGSFQSTLEEMSGRTSLKFGKPGLNLSKYILKEFSIQNPSRTLFIGDSLDQDMNFANKSGFQTLLVLTGVTTIERLQECTNKEKIPDYYVTSLAVLSEEIKNKLNI